MSNGNNFFEPHRPAPPAPSGPPTSQDLRNTMQASLSSQLHLTYYQHWELLQRGHVRREVFDNGVTNRHTLLNTPELLLLHARIANIQEPMPEPYTKEDYSRLVLACNVVFMNGNLGLVELMKAHSEVITRMNMERGRRGL